MSPRKASPLTKDERTLRATLERWMENDATCQQLAREIRRAQKALRDAVPEETWRLYLVLEEHHNARQLRIVERLLALAANRRRR